MTTISLNSSEVKLQSFADLTLTDFMDHLLEKHLNREQVITGIRVNGKLLSLEEENAYLNEKVSNFGSIDFQVQTTFDLAFEALDSCSSYIDVVTTNIRELIELYSGNKIEEANYKFSDIIDIMDLFVQLMSKINRTLKSHLNESYKKSPTLHNLEIHLLSVLKGLIPAKEKNDIIMLCDLLEYELIDNLTQWKIKAIPELKSLRSF
jgi:superfamily II RNA helicase